MKNSFQNCINLKNISISGFDTENLNSTSYLFSGTNISYFNLSDFRTNNVLDMSHMFSDIKNKILNFLYIHNF